ncbi:MAG: hypothetical protein ACI857_002550 [Arenicella sp.]|jgi:hypothetical protein
MNYHNKKFKVVYSSSNGDIDDKMIFHYVQNGNVLSCSYSGPEILSGHLIGLVNEDGAIEMRYHQVNSEGELKTGKCDSIPEVMPNGKMRLNETWQWLSGAEGSGTSILEEV